MDTGEVQLSDAARFSDVFLALVCRLKLALRGLVCIFIA